MNDKVRGAGSDGMRENPPVTSKFDRDKGKPRTPGKVSHPGGTAKETGSKHPGFMDSGHMLPKEAKMGHGEHTVTHHSPGATGHHEGNYLMTDSIRQETGEDSP
jgi:hypothetical protein